MTTEDFLDDKENLESRYVFAENGISVPTTKALALVSLTNYYRTENPQPEEAEVCSMNHHFHFIQLSNRTIKA